MPADPVVPDAIPAACPKCRGPLRDLRGAAFSPGQVSGCFVYNAGDLECRGGILGAEAKRESPGALAALPVAATGPDVAESAKGDELSTLQVGAGGVGYSPGPGDVRALHVLGARQRVSGMSDEKPQGLEDIRFRNGILDVEIWYPRCEGPRIREVMVGLMDVRAADSIRISYDFDRDGYVIKQAVTYEDLMEGPDDGVEEWREVAFIQAWALQVPAKKAAGG